MKVVVLDGPCIEWPGPRNKQGYGNAGKRYKGKRLRAHQAAFLAAHGYLPKVVRHACDNPACVSVKHLIAGDHTDNINDMHQRGRARGKQKGNPPGAGHPMAKLTPAQVQAIRQDPRPQRAIAASYGIRQPQVSRIKTGTRWK